MCVLVCVHVCVHGVCTRICTTVGRSHLNWATLQPGLRTSGGDLHSGLKRQAGDIVVWSLVAQRDLLRGDEEI